MHDHLVKRNPEKHLPSSSPPKRRAWRKLHIVVNADTGEILASALITHCARDAAQVPVLLTQINDPLVSAMADSTYDTSSVIFSSRMDASCHGNLRVRGAAAVPLPAARH
ncbi:MAG: transposase [Pseudomonadales bacterium]